MPVRTRMAMNGLTVALLAIVIAPAVAQASTELLVEYSGTYNETATKSVGGKPEVTTVAYTWNEQGTAPVTPTSEPTAASVKSLSIAGTYSVTVSGKEKKCTLSASKTFALGTKLAVWIDKSAEPHVHATAPLPRETGTEAGAGGLAAEGCALPIQVPNDKEVEAQSGFGKANEATLERTQKELFAEKLPPVIEPISFSAEPPEDKVTITGELKAQILLNITPPVITIPKITIKSPGASTPGTSSPAPHVLSPAILSLAGALTGKPRASATSVRGITMKCPSGATRCQATGTLTTVLSKRARAAAAVNKRHRPATHATVIGSKAVTVAGGHGTPLVVKLSRHGRALLAAHRRLHVTLTVAIIAATPSGLVRSTRRFQLVLVQHKR
jgi:hypothetical protein